MDGMDLERAVWESVKAIAIQIPIAPPGLFVFKGVRMRRFRVAWVAVRATWTSAKSSSVDYGSFYIFTRPSSLDESSSLETQWSEQAKIYASDQVAYDMFGSALTLYGDTALIGASGKDNRKVYVFEAPPPAPPSPPPPLPPPPLFLSSMLEDTNIKLRYAKDGEN